MSISMSRIIEMADNRLKKFFPNPELFDLSPFGIENLRDCILMFIIKDAYYLTEPKQSLRANRGTDSDDQRMRDSRTIAYAQHYRDLQFSQIKKSSKIEISELLPDDVKSMDGKISGHKLTPMQYFELNIMADHPLLKAIINKRICDVKKISNATFIEYMQDYDELTNHLVKKLDGTDEDVVFATVALFTLEWKYNVELFYSCAVEAEKTNTKEVLVDRLAALCANITLPLLPYCQTLRTESRFVLHRMELVSNIYSSTDSEWDEIQDKLMHYLLAEYYIRTETIHKWDMSEFFARNTTKSQWAQFFREHYDLRRLYIPKEWTNARIRYMRKTYSVMIQDMNTPKI